MERRVRKPSPAMAKEGFYEFTKNPRPGKCAVKFCRRNAMRDRCLCHRHHQRRWRAQNPERAAYATLRDHARYRGFAFTITFEEFLEVMGSYFNDSGKLTLTVDRIDPDRGYEPGNIQPLTLSENVAKGNRERHREPGEDEEELDYDLAIYDDQPYPYEAGDVPF